HVSNSNADAVGDDDNAWGIGLKAKLADFKLSYEYRDLGINAVNDSFDDSDFTKVSDAKGSIIKVGYDIDKDFSVGATYYTSESNVDHSELDLLHLDVKVKF
ncbi:MAG TPA: hypothetical protein DCR13_02605, partial [Gammaproteobacteria bacterium]|nr:hypothetical protein [Gammaproteobacteria bacterium]